MRRRSEEHMGRATALATGLLLLAGCTTHTVKVQAPDKPIELNINVKIEQEVRVKVDREVEELLADESLY